MDRITALQAFVRLAELRSFSAAAHDLRVRQSTVSKWIAALEDELDAQLVARTTRSVQITDAGAAFLADARNVLAAYESATQNLRGAPPLRGRLRVSVPVVFGRLFVLPAVRTFARKHRGIELELVFNDRYVNLVDEGIDVAVRVGTPVDSSFRSLKIGSTPRHIVASPGYLERFGPITRPEELRNHQCLLHSGLSVGGSWRLSRAGKIRHVAVRGRFSANNSEALLALAKGGMGIAMLAAWLVEGDLANGKLVAVLPDYDLPPAPIAVLTPPTRHPSARAKAFTEHIRGSLTKRFGTT